MRASAEPHFVKTHRPRDESVEPGDRAICRAAAVEVSR
jgi:hypothetical protein